MSISKLRIAGLMAASLVMVPAAANEWSSAPSEAGVSYPAPAPSTLTREQYLARWAEERRAMAAKGYKWDVLYSTYVFIGPGSPEAAASTMTRDEFLANEAAQDRPMRDKGLKWNQLLGTYERAR